MILFATASICLSACGNNKDNSDKIADSVGNESPTGPAPDNSNATNPSLPDTAFTDTSGQH
ncbi:hypothetical protein FRZ67_19675 [Panacibacter ginsenosidivorans]|uniref:Uncharacterized protein n=1 Tax=Panacibacter ginsenosidivorans TaxID=1813871 RepID=A0A5B8VDM2_9BACT|nr:hypothetical protein [Panacibacter ginsenosidivorans]QEC69412.1 hypothetical protein FRZ67_19675 [Panacibacter ginsenosidivorans]